MTNKELIQYAETALADSIDIVRSAREFDPFGVLIETGGGCKSITANPSSVFLGAERSAQFLAYLRRRIEETRPQAAVVVSLIWLAKPQSAEAAQEISSLRLNTRQAEERGLAIRSEAFLVSLETRDGFAYRIVQGFERRPFALLPRAEAGEATGRLFGLFDRPAPTPQSEAVQ